MEGNQNEMREALLKIRAEIGRFYNNEWIPYDAWQECDDAISHALSAPARQCDVGTAEEQIRRIRSYCKQHRVGLRCVDCPVHGGFPKDCALIWAQTPYETEEGARK